MSETAASAWTERPTSEIEEWLLDQLDRRPPAWDAIRALLEQVGQRPERRAEARSWAELVLERMKKEEACAEGVDLVERLAAWEGEEDPGMAQSRARERLTDLFSLKVGGRLFLEAAEAGGASLDDVLRRLRLLLALREGRFCYHRSLGGGIIRRVDPFYGKVTVDFAGRPGHELSFAFAADSLTLPSDDHLMALWYRDPAAIRAMAQEHPDELIRLALRSEGPATLARLETLLAPMVGQGPAWKTFWTAARKRLQERGDVLLPARKIEPLRLVSRVLSAEERWVELLRTERRPDRLVPIFESLAEDPDRPEKGGTWETIAREKLAAVWLAAADRPEWAARAFLVAEALGLPPDPAVEAAWRARWREADFLSQTLNALPVRRLGDFLRWLHRTDPELAGRLLASVSALHFSVLGELLELLIREGWESEVRDRLTRMARERRESIRLLAWMARHPDRVASWSLMPLEELPFRIIEALHYPASGEDLKAANTLRACLQEREWLQQVCEGMDATRRADLMRLALHPDAPRHFDAQLLLSRLVALYPELSGRLEASETRPAAPALTSWRSYRQRQAQLERLIREEIPRNARDIERARSYGDLRENHEYKTAKENQALLLRRQQEWQRDLQTVKPTDFAGFPCDRAGLGTEIEIERDDGQREVYRILGEWDFDETLRVISCKSGLAEALRGRTAGEMVDLPSERGTPVRARLTAVRPLPPDVLAWASGDPTADSP